MAYKISEGCVCCQKCTFACPKQAIRFDGEPVKGLWCGGDVTSGNFVKVMQRRYEMINDFTWALASGFIAARDICSKI